MNKGNVSLGGTTGRIADAYPWILLVFLFVCCSFALLAGTYWGGHYVTPDDSYYFREAVSLLHGYGLRYNAESGDIASYFSQWPAGYPALIAAVSYITGAELYLAVKIVSIAVLFFTFGILCIQFGRSAWICVLVLALNPSFFYHSAVWAGSEPPFILGVLWLSYGIYLVVSRENPKWYHYLSVFLAAAFAFFMRYTGAFSAGLIGIAFMYCLVQFFAGHERSHLKKCAGLFAAGFAFSCLVALYLYLNYKNTGHIGGEYRTYLAPNKRITMQGIIDYTLAVSQNQFQWINKAVPVVNFSAKSAFFINLGIGYGIFCHYYHKRKTGCSILPLVYLLTALACTCSYLFLGLASEVRYGYEFSRYLLPSNVLLTVCCMTIILEYKQNIALFLGKLPYFPLFLKSAAVLTFILYMFLEAYYLDQNVLGYAKMRDRVLKDLEEIPPQSLVISSIRENASGGGGALASFLRPDLRVRDRHWPFSLVVDSSIIDAYRNVYLYFENPRGEIENDEYLKRYAPFISGGAERLIKVK